MGEGVKRLGQVRGVAGVVGLTLSSGDEMSLTFEAGWGGGRIRSP